jgi:hypothetical protein
LISIQEALNENSNKESIGEPNEKYTKNNNDIIYKNNPNNKEYQKITYSQMETIEIGYKYQIILEIEKDYNDTNVMKLSDYLKKKKYDKKKVDNFDKSNLSYIEVDLIVSDIINQINMQIEKNIYIDSINPEGIYIINNNYILLDFDYSKKKIDIYEKLLIFIETILDSDIETIKDTIKNTLLYKIIINLQESRIMEIY